MSNNDLNSYIWEHKYQPKRIKDMILPVDYKNFFQKIIDDNASVNLLLESNTPGTGKCLDFSELINIKISEELYEQYKDLFED